MAAQSRGSAKALVRPLKLSLEAMATLLVVGGLDELAVELGGQDAADPVAGDGGLGAQGDEQVGLAVVRVADEAERLPLADPLARGEVAEGLGGNAGLAWKSKVRSSFCRGKHAALVRCSERRRPGRGTRPSAARRGTRGRSSALSDRRSRRAASPCPRTKPAHLRSLRHAGHAASEAAVRIPPPAHRSGTPAARTLSSPSTWAVPALPAGGPRISPHPAPVGRDLQPLLNHSGPGPGTAYLTGKALTRESARPHRRGCLLVAYDARRPAAIIRSGPDLGLYVVAGARSELA
jgi:hypothetical protein